MSDRKPEDIKVNDGLTKVHEAAKLISEEEINRLAEKAKEQAELNMAKHEAKKASVKNS